MAKEAEKPGIKPPSCERADCMYSFGKIEAELGIQKEMLEQTKALFDAKLLAIDKAQDIASKTMDKRLESMNEFRDTLRDQASRLATREELRKESERIEVDLRFLRESRAVLEGKASQKFVSFTLGITILGLVLSVISILVNIVGHIK